MEVIPLKELACRTASKVVIDDSNERMEFTFHDGSIATFMHIQDCCETVHIAEISGDLCDLIGQPLLVAEMRTTSDFGAVDDQYKAYAMDESNTWTFYTFRTIKGTVDVRWIGSSNGYYSEEVDFYFQEAV